MKLRVETDFALDDSEEVFFNDMDKKFSPTDDNFSHVFQLLKLNIMIYNTWNDERLSMANVTKCWQNANDSMIQSVCSSPEKHLDLLRHTEVGPSLKVTNFTFVFLIVNCKVNVSEFAESYMDT